MGDYDMAFEHYQKMLDLKPGMGSYSRAAHLLFITGDFKKANLLMSKAIGSGGAYSENAAWCIAQKALLDFAQGGYEMCIRDRFSRRLCRHAQSRTCALDAPYPAPSTDASCQGTDRPLGEQTAGPRRQAVLAGRVL